jgi:DNA-binding NarL/FixJ family response regulator
VDEAGDPLVSEFDSWSAPPENPPIKVAVFEPRPLVAEGIAALLVGARGVDVVGATTHLGEAVRMIVEAGVQVVVFGSESQRPEQVRELAAQFEAAAAAGARQIGLVCIVAGGQAAADELSSADLPTVVSTGVSVQSLRDAIDAAYSGGDGTLPLQVVRRRITSSIGSAAAPVAALTERERDVLRGLAAGLSTREIAAQLGITVNTVRTHVQHLMPKLGVHTRLHAAAIAAVERLVDESQPPRQEASHDHS